MTAKDDVVNAAVGDNNILYFQNNVDLPEASRKAEAVEGLREAAKEAPQTETPQEQEQKKERTNPDLKEVQETGTWGRLSRSEFHVVMGVIAMIVIAVVVLVVLVLTHVIGKKSPTQKQVLLNEILAGLHSSNNTELTVQTLPTNVDFYRNKTNDPSAGFEIQALSWLLYVDEYNHGDIFVDESRFALVAFYLALDGPNWFNSTNWVTSTDYCDWHGILCDIQGNVSALQLNSNNLGGMIPPELSLVSNLVSLDFSNNHLTGPLPGETLSALQRLVIINVANNSLTGTIPDDLNGNQPESTFTLFLNNFTGDFPYCYYYQGYPYAVMTEFEIDCIKVNCTCCNPHTNCFQH